MANGQPSKKIASNYPASNYPPLIEALRGLGVDPDQTRRVVIDIVGGSAPVVYVELYGDDTVVSVVEALSSVEIERK